MDPRIGIRKCSFWLITSSIFIIIFHMKLSMDGLNKDFRDLTLGKKRNECVLCFWTFYLSITTPYFCNSVVRVFHLGHWHYSETAAMPVARVHYTYQSVFQLFTQPSLICQSLSKYIFNINCYQIVNWILMEFYLMFYNNR